jgi:SAM-dependent methyltransferase
MGQLPPLLLAVLAQGIALLLVKLLPPLMPEMLAARLILQGSIAAMAGRLLKLPFWWVPINLLLPLAVVTTLTLELPSWLFLLAFIALLLIQWNSGSEQVPLYLSNRKTWQQLEKLLPQASETCFVDVGSGLGGTLFHLARRHPAGHFTGIESAPIPFAISRLRLKLSGLKNVELRYGSFWNEELSHYNVLYAFLSPVPMQRLYDKARHEMKRGSLFISNSFTVPGAEAERVLEVNDRRRTKLYYWRLDGSERPDSSS